MRVSKLKNVEKAMKVLSETPIPSDARKQIDDLYKISSKDEKSLFSMIYEGLTYQECDKTSISRDDYESIMDNCAFEIAMANDDEIYSSEYVEDLLKTKT